jgi:hypothetical protein
MFEFCRGPAAVVVPIALSLACAGCDTQIRARVAAVSLVGPVASVPVVRFSPQTLMPLPTAGFGCPQVQPFTTVFDLIVDGRGSMDVFLTQVTIRFVDGSSFGGSPLIFSNGDLSARFGQTLVPADTTRAFGFTPQFGCGVSRPHTIVADIVLLDRQGSNHPMSLIAPIL